ncbi:hypothetical protein E4U17_000339 [Claviceps sp. LM77 group G4]|nr:hypothetical protein E4U17_000339 [Claviceps sp. LM77 group G4]KAG6068358.1 hypothetical protein E4U16_007972 [Claviceps sp. LM84 group G4]KAG6074326.1 hypothetical protein E4U33_002568 [Claviceps sp. LM78 group G4]
MAELQIHSQDSSRVATTPTPTPAPAPAPMASPMAAPTRDSPQDGPQNQKRASVHQIYALPAPIRTFPLPAFIPSSILSLLHVGWTWLQQTFSPPPAEPAIIHHGVWDEATGSVHITDGQSMRALWEQGFYGKGSLSRSEPNWLKREMVRQGQEETHVSEILTAQRREERARVKWERARLEQEAIRQTRLEEARLAASASPTLAASPSDSSAAIEASVGALELLPTADSEADRAATSLMESSKNGNLAAERQAVDAPSCPLELLLPLESEADILAKPTVPVADSARHTPGRLEAVDTSPVGPLELLHLPNSEADRLARSRVRVSVGPLVLLLPLSDSAAERAVSSVADSAPPCLVATPEATDAAPVGPLELLRLPNSEADRVARLQTKGPARPRELSLPDTETGQAACLTVDSRTRHSLEGSEVVVAPGIDAPPVGPLELLRLPNSEADRLFRVKTKAKAQSPARPLEPDAEAEAGSMPSNKPDAPVLESIESVEVSPVGPLELLRLPNSEADRVARQTSRRTPDAFTAEGEAGQSDITPPSSEISPKTIPARRVCPSVEEPPIPEDAGCHPTPGDVPCRDAAEEMSQQQKSVRFSPQVEPTTFSLADPSPQEPTSPSAQMALPATEASGLASEVSSSAVAQEGSDGSDGPDRSKEEEIVNREHLQLTPEEAYFLSFGLGALSVTDPSTGRVLSNQDMLTLFRQYSYFPPRIEADDAALQPDDGFLVQYAVYHHYRSLGWVPRAGIKFGVDWLLYARGPVFDHAEFGLIVVPSYSDAWWKAQGTQAPRKTWYWLHGIVRVLAHVIKSLILVYVDVPSGPQFEAAMEKGFAEALKLYRVREVTVKRWSSNRNR